jgi:hypothetical protein
MQNTCIFKTTSQGLMARYPAQTLYMNHHSKPRLKTEYDANALKFNEPMRLLAADPYLNKHKLKEEQFLLVEIYLSKH